jgi:hypothetical protein
LKTSKTALAGLVSHEVRGWQPSSWNPSSFCFPFFPSYFLRIYIGLA